MRAGDSSHGSLTLLPSRDTQASVACSTPLLSTTPLLSLMGRPTTPLLSQPYFHRPLRCPLLPSPCSVSPYSHPRTPLTVLQGLACSRRIDLGSGGSAGAGPSAPPASSGAGSSIWVALLSRKSIANPGTRYNARGLNEVAGAGNEVVTPHLPPLVQASKPSPPHQSSNLSLSPPSSTSFQPPPSLLPPPCHSRDGYIVWRVRVLLCGGRRGRHRFLRLRGGGGGFGGGCGGGSQPCAHMYRFCSMDARAPMLGCPCAVCPCSHAVCLCPVPMHCVCVLCP